MKRYYTRIFLIFLFAGIVNNGFSGVLIRQDFASDLPVAPVYISKESLSSGQNLLNQGYVVSEASNPISSASTPFISAGGPDGISQPNGTVAATNLLEAPSPPADLNAVGINGSTIRLNWSHDMVNVEKFVIERYGFLSFSQIAEVPATVTSYDDSGLFPLINYSYRVKAVFGEEDSDYSNVASSFTAIIPTVPAAPTNLTASTATSRSITLKWTDNADNEDNYVVERGQAQDGPFDETDLPANTETITDVDLAANATYFYKVKATNAVGSSDYTATISASTLDEAPAVPSGLTATPLSSSSIRLQWTDNALNETGYVIERSPTATDADFVPLTTTGADINTYDDIDLSPNTSYYYRVKATNAVGDSENTPAVAAKTLDIAPLAPSGLKISTKTANTITLGWIDSSTNETGFEIQKSIISAATGFEELTTTAANATTFEDKNLTPNTSYHYRVRAVNAVGESDFITISGKTDDIAPTAPSGLEVSAKTASTITLAWTDLSNNETGFVLERSSTSATAGFAPLKTTAANITTFEDTGLSPNTTYHYRLKAINAVGESGPVSVSATTNDVAPKAPSGLAISGPTISTLTLKWVDASDNETNFEIQRSETPASAGFTVLTTVPANTSTYLDSDLISNTTYYYRVRATNAIGASGFSATASGKTAIDLPVTPLNLTFSKVTTSTIELSWTDVSTNQPGFELVRSRNNTTFTVVAELAPGTTSFVDENLAPNTTYYYKVRAVNKDGASPYGNTVSPTTLREVGPPAAPTLLKATAITTFQINLTWKDNADNETSYIVERSLSETGLFNRIATLPANSTFYENTGLDAGITYYYRVKAINIDGEPVSNISSATTLSNPTPPSAPAGLSAVAVSTVQINLTWIDRSNSETNFTIQRAEEQDGTFELIASVGANVTSYQNFGLKPNTTYYYKVRAESGDGVSDYSNTDNATTLQEARPPSAPSSLTALGVSTRQINLQWVDNSNSETNFIIERSSTLDGTYNFIAAVGANVTSYQNTGLSVNTEYFYKVRAINNDGTSGYSKAASATTMAVSEPPFAPTNLVANGVSTTQINLTWEDKSVNETNFEIHRSSSADGPFTFLVNVAANQTTYENTGLRANTTYYYRVRASNGDGPSTTFSNVAAGTTSEQPQPPATPDGLTALAVSTTQIILRWNDKAFNETGYDVERSTNGVDFSIVNTVQANDTVFENFGLSPNTEYTYRVRAQSGDGVSGYSNTATATTFENKVPPIAPSDLFVKPLSQSEVELFWTDNSNNEQEFKVERAELETEGQTTANFVIVKELPSNTNYFVDVGLKPNTIYKYRIQATNSDGNTYSNEFVVFTSIGGNPVIVTLSRNYPRFFASQGEDTVVSIKVAEPELYTSVLFKYKGVTEGDYKSDIPVSTNGDEYAVTVTKNHLDEMGIEYYFEARDAEGNPSVSAKGFTYWKMDDPGLEIPDLKFGETVSDYQMISIPLVLDQKRIVDVLEDDLGTYDPSQWRLFHFEKGAMLERGAFIDLLPGKSYWLIVKDTDTINTGAGNVVEAHNGDPFKLELNQGWNQIGNPYMFEISWNAVKQANGNPDFLGPLISYDGTYTETQTLGVFQGAYVHSGEATTLVFPIGVQDGGTAGRYSTAAAGKFKGDQETGSGWNIGFSLSARDLVYNLSGLGMHSEASLSKDKFDRIALPKLPSYLDINFSHPEYFSPEFTRDIVPVQESYVWDMKVISSLGDKPVTINWEKAEKLPQGMNLILFDPVRHKRIDMTSVEKYVVSGEATLQVYYGDDAFIAENLKAKAAFIGAIYPNPFSDAFTIPVALPESELSYSINVVIYNNVGRQIAEPYHFTIEGGYQDIQLFGDTLQQLNDGLYFYKINISQKEDVIKEAVGRIIKR